MHMRKKHLFLKAKLIEFASTDALPPDERAQRRGGLESGKTANETQSNVHLGIHAFFVCMYIYKAKRMTRWESGKTGGA